MTVTDSWIEVPSRPSSASLGSVADEVVTHGLRVQHASNNQRRRRRRLDVAPQLATNKARPTSAGGSSQEEYDESESESDRVLTSSEEGHSAAQTPEEEGLSATSVNAEQVIIQEDEVENATALGVNTHDQNCFTPQPNAFSHPPSSQSRNHAPSVGSYFPITRPTRPRTPFQRHSFSNQETRRNHSPYNAISPNHTADHEAALRASLTTLLSCAAAARSLPKPDTNPNHKRTTTQPPQRQHPNSTRVDPTTIRMIPASALNLRSTSATPSDRPTSSQSQQQIPSSAASISSSTSPSKTKNKRKARSPSTSKDRALKRLRSVQGIDEAGISPTLLTWVVSASVLVLVSALSFSAGYSVGRETGRVEAGAVPGGGFGGEGRGCGRQAAGRGSGLGLRRRLLSASGVVA